MEQPKTRKPRQKKTETSEEVPKIRKPRASKKTKEVVENEPEETQTTSEKMEEQNEHPECGGCEECPVDPNVPVINMTVTNSSDKSIDFKLPLSEKFLIRSVKTESGEEYQLYFKQCTKMISFLYCGKDGAIANFPEGLRVINMNGSAENFEKPGCHLFYAMSSYMLLMNKDIVAFFRAVTYHEIEIFTDT